MSKQKPNIITPFNDRARFKSLVQEVINDTTIFTHIPDSISLDSATNTLFTLTLSNKKFNFDEIQVDRLADYVDIYLQGIKKPADVYSVAENGTDITIVFTESITLRPVDIINTDFSVKGKIVSR